MTSTQLVPQVSDLYAVNKYLPQGILICDVQDNFRVVEANDAYFEVLGFTRKEFFDRFDNFGIHTVYPEDIEYTLEQFTEQTSASPQRRFAINTRLIHKTKKSIWTRLAGQVVTDAQGRDLIHFIVADVSEQYALFHALEKEYAFNNLIIELSGDAFFELELDSRVLRLSKQFADMFQLPEFIQGFPESLALYKVVPPAVIQFLQKTLQTDCEKQESRGELELNLNMPDDSTRWYRVAYSILPKNNTNKDSNSQQLEENQILWTHGRAVGKLTDITKQKEHLFELHEQASRDALTGFYNKKVTEKKIQELLDEENALLKQHVLLIIDIDHFKNVNDTLGHLQGDRLLTQCATRLRALFRGQDILGRIGGDEFFVFIRDIKDMTIAAKKAAAVCDALGSIVVNEGMSISASVGFVVFPDHGLSLNVLYKKADAALYYVKQQGRNGYAMYNKNIMHINN